MIEDFIMSRLRENKKERSVCRFFVSVITCEIGSTDAEGYAVGV